MERAVKLCVYTLILLTMATLLASRAQAGSFSYVYNIGPDGEGEVAITFTSTQHGSTWLLVPRGLGASSLDVEEGAVLSREVSEARPLHVFYENLSFSYLPSEGGVVRVTIKHRAPYVALIEEPKGLFFSTKVMASPLDDVEVAVLLPKGGTGDVKVHGVASYRVDEVDGRVKLVAFSRPAEGRLIVEFRLNGTAEYVEAAQGLFKVKAPARYRDLAHRILSLYLEAYLELRGLFNTELEKVEARLYVPGAEDVVKGVGGFVPFSGDRPGEISLNIFYVRAINGTLEVIAIHELAHHFLWRVGIKPSLLWVHEGLAEYISIEVGKWMKLGRGVEEHEGALVSAASQLSSLGFIQSWRP
ncbi:MAG: hypothetical protein N3H31_03450, partial [Candidatus Nezhaarchaeota archaeon]|nr:hypothetical protein [Candidatus Nezhaarchaeota archaeon]